MNNLEIPLDGSMYLNPNGMYNQGGFQGLGIGNPASYMTASQVNPWWMPHVSDAFGGFAGMGQIAAAPATLADMFTYRNPDQSSTGGFMTGALKGATAGSMWGPWGAGIGALTGGLSGKK